jgi:hypothetical protein
VATVALGVALLLLIPAAISTGCADAGYCDDYSALQIAFRAGLEFAPVWMLCLAALAFFRRRALVIFAVLAVVLAVMSVLVYTDLRLMLRPIGLSNASGFIFYALPFAVAAGGAFVDIRKTRPSVR